MAINSAAVLGLLLSFIFLSLLPFSAWGLSSCGGSCGTLDDCEGQLIICINGKCNDDPDIGTHICGNSPSIYPLLPLPPPPPGRAILTNNNFEQGGPGASGLSKCDGKYHNNSERIVALSTRWYANGSRCGKMIRITTKNGRSTEAKAVDECDSADGCRNNIVDGSDGVWNALGVDINVGEVSVTWPMA